MLSLCPFLSSASYGELILCLSGACNIVCVRELTMHFNTTCGFML